MWTPIIGLIIGIIIGTLLPLEVLSVSNQVLTILVICATDALFCGLYAKIEKRFNALLFTFELILNLLIAFAIVYFGVIMGYDLFMAIAIIFGVRIFHNLSTINQKLFIS